MSRILIFFVVTAFLFFSGVAVGMIEKRSPLEEQEIERMIERQIKQEEEMDVMTESEMAPSVIVQEKFIHRVAANLETLVTSIYEIIIQVLYKIAASIFD